MFQDFGVKALSDQHREIRATDAAGEVAALVDRYPNLSEIELAKLINLYRGLSALDMALMISDEELSPKLDRFVADHHAHLRAPFGQYAVLVAIAGVGIAIAVWASISGQF